MEHIQKLLGHNQLDTTLVYAKVSDRQTKGFVNDAFNMPMKLIAKQSGFNASEAAQKEAQISQPAPTAQVESAIEILRKRLAKGELDILTYKRLMAELSPENTVNIIHTLNSS